jgi:hypothetical protein
MVLGHDATAKVRVSWDIDFASERQEAIDLRPFSTSDDASAMVPVELLGSLCYWLLKLHITKAASNISEDLPFFPFHMDT